MEKLGSLNEKEIKSMEGTEIDSTPAVEQISEQPIDQANEAIQATESESSMRAIIDNAIGKAMEIIGKATDNKTIRRASALLGALTALASMPAPALAKDLYVVNENGSVSPYTENQQTEIKDDGYQQDSKTLNNWLDKHIRSSLEELTRIMEDSKEMSLQTDKMSEMTTRIEQMANNDFFPMDTRTWPSVRKALSEYVHNYDELKTKHHGGDLAYLDKQIGQVKDAIHAIDSRIDHLTIDEAAERAVLASTNIENPQLQDIADKNFNPIVAEIQSYALADQDVKPKTILEHTQLTKLLLTSIDKSNLSGSDKAFLNYMSSQIDRFEHNFSSHETDHNTQPALETMTK